MQRCTVICQKLLQLDSKTERGVVSCQLTARYMVHSGKHVNAKFVSCSIHIQLFQYIFFFV